MTPPCHTFPASDLPLQVQFDVQGKRRKTEGGKKIDLNACELLSLVQHNCKVEHPQKRDSPVLCYPVQRWFRRCNDKKGNFMVETTAWEGTPAATATTTTTTTPLTHPKHQNTTYWHDGNKTEYFPSA